MRDTWRRVPPPRAPRPGTRVSRHIPPCPPPVRGTHWTGVGDPLATTLPPLIPNIVPAIRVDMGSSRVFSKKKKPQHKLQTDRLGDDAALSCGAHGRGCVCGHRTAGCQVPCRRVYVAGGAPSAAVPAAPDCVRAPPLVPGGWPSTASARSRPASAATPGWRQTPSWSATCSSTRARACGSARRCAGTTS